jgi:phosphatidylglycerophosphate synthase
MAIKESRRPLKARDWKVIQATARRLSQRDVTPNQISVTSIFFSALSAICLISLPVEDNLMTWALCLLAGFFILCRALCNIFDGMVAVEGGKGTRSGELFNDIPDRISDPVILIAAGYATEVVSWAPEAGWLAALCAVLTAYTRTLARSLGAPVDFQGPMAKTHRMAVIAGACVLAPLESQGYIFLAALLIVIVGCFVTIWRRAHTAYISLEGMPNV